MPATRQRTSLLAVGCNLVLSEDKPEQPARVERSGPYPVKLVHTRSESRVTEQVTAADSASAAANLFVVRAERGVRGGARQAVPRPRAGDIRGERSDCTPGPRSQLQPSAQETCTELNPLLCHYLKTFWINAHISAEDKLFNSLTMK